MTNCWLVGLSTQKGMPLAAKARFICMASSSARLVLSKYSPLSSMSANCSPISQPFANTAPCCFMYALKRYWRRGSVMMRASPKSAPHFVPPI